MKIYKDILQKSPEWFALKEGKMTASHAQAIGSNGKGLNTYIIELMSEYYSSGEEDNYTNKNMDRGNDLEPQARMIYELETGKTVEQVGFIEHNEFSGCSPDGLVDDGLMEIKCQNDKIHFSHLLNGGKEISSKYIWQMQMQMLVSGRKWCDFVSYNPNFKESIFSVRITADEEKHKKLLEGLKAGEEMIKNIKGRIK